MKKIYLFCLIPISAFSQRVPVDWYNYDDLVTIDRYYGEADSILLAYSIREKKTFLENDSLQLLQIEKFKGGKRLKSEDIDLESGKPKRTISYFYPTENILEVEMKHFPASDNYYLGPSLKYLYLWKYLDHGKTINLRYKKDIDTIVYVKLRYEWLTNGDILFHTYDIDSKVIDSVLMKRIINPVTTPNRDDQSQDDTTYFSDRTIREIDQRDNKGKLRYWKQCESKIQCREYKFTYDQRGLEVRREYYQNGKLNQSLVYKYE